MNGREEADLIINKNINELLNGKPEYLKLYRLQFDGTVRSFYEYLKKVIRHIDWLSNNGIDINDVTAFNNVKKSMIKIYINDLSKTDIKGSSIRGHLAAIKNFYSFLLGDEYISSNPCLDVKVRKKDGDSVPETIFLTQEEVKKIRDNIISGDFIDRHNLWRRDLAIFSIGCTTGLRCSAIREINMEDVNLTDGTIKVITKGNIERICYLNEKTLVLLKNYMAVRERTKPKTNALFVSFTGNRIDNSGMQHILDKYTAGVVDGKRITPHKMRHTCATILQEMTGDVSLVKEVLMHESAQSTYRYIHATQNRKKEGADKFSNLFN